MTARQRRRHRRSQGSSVGKKVVLVFVGLFAVIGVALGGGVIWVLNVAADAPDIDTLKPADSGSNTQIFAGDGTSLGYVQSDILRTPVALDEIPERLQKATIAIEDEHFYDHGGVDYSAIIRAAVENFEAGEVKQGASTITQQLVRNLYIRDPRDTIERKIKEAKMAMQYEDEYTKNQILNQYLNTASYGTNNGKTAVGVEAASQVYFDKDVADLNIGEAALLAGLPQAPTDYNPFINPKGAKQRRNEVLAAMRDQGYITPATYDKITSRGLGLRPRLPLRAALAAVLLRLRPAGADRQVRGRDGARRRAQGLYDARPGPAGGRRAGDRGTPGHRRRRGAGLDRRRHRRDHRDGLLVRRTRTASSTWPPRAAASRAPRSSPTR